MSLVRSFFEPTEIETREEENKKTVYGYAATFEKLSDPMCGIREKIRAGAFKTSLEKNNIRALWSHKTDQVLGSTRSKTLRLLEDNKGLFFEIDLPDTTLGRDAFTLIKRKDVEGMSFGFNVNKEEWGQSDSKKIVRTLIDVDLIEISMTAFPRYPDTQVKARSIEEDYIAYVEASKKTDIEKNIRALALLIDSLTIKSKE